MSLPKALLIFALSAVVGPVGGAALGFCLGRFAPAYYYAVVPPRPGVPYDPVAVGVGLGADTGSGRRAVRRRRHRPGLGRRRAPAEQRGRAVRPTGVTDRRTDADPSHDPSM